MYQFWLWVALPALDRAAGGARESVSSLRQVARKWGKRRLFVGAAAGWLLRFQLPDALDLQPVAIRASRYGAPVAMCGDLTCRAAAAPPGGAPHAPRLEKCAAAAWCSCSHKLPASAPCRTPAGQAPQGAAQGGGRGPRTAVQLHVQLPTFRHAATSMPARVRATRRRGWIFSLCGRYGAGGASRTDHARYREGSFSGLLNLNASVLETKRDYARHLSGPSGLVNARAPLRALLPLWVPGEGLWAAACWPRGACAPTHRPGRHVASCYMCVFVRVRACVCVCLLQDYEATLRHPRAG
jgi:hypothetical protein